MILISDVLVRLLQKNARMVAMQSTAQLLAKIVPMVPSVQKMEWNHHFPVVMVLMLTRLVYHLAYPARQVIFVEIHV